VVGWGNGDVCSEGDAGGGYRVNKETVFVVREGEDYEEATQLLAAFNTLGQAQEFCDKRWPTHTAWEVESQAVYWAASKTGPDYDPQFIEIAEVVLNPQEGDPL
jgi:hypothetical protein